MSLKECGGAKITSLCDKKFAMGTNERFLIVFEGANEGFMCVGEKTNLLCQWSKVAST